MSATGNDGATGSAGTTGDQATGDGASAPAADGPDIFDAHLHIIDRRFPLVANQGFVPPPFTVADYRAAVAGLPGRVVGGAVVSGSFQGTDQTYLVAALQALGPGFVGVTQLDPAVSDRQIRWLASQGVRAVRGNLRRGGRSVLDGFEGLARRVVEVAGWHAELYLDARDLTDLEPRLRALPQAVIDHFGLPEDLGGPAFTALLRLVEAGAKVKATGFGRMDVDVAAALQAIAEVDPSALLFGTDLPSTRAPRPFRPGDVDLVVDALSAPLARRVMHDNAATLYGQR